MERTQQASPRDAVNRTASDGARLPMCWCKIHSACDAGGRWSSLSRGILERAPPHQHRRLEWGVRSHMVHLRNNPEGPEAKSQEL